MAVVVDTFVRNSCLRHPYL